MSAASPKIQDSAQEPSMEEILASIRRIIADDQAAKPEDSEPANAPPQPQNDDVLDLAEVAKPVRKPEPAPAPEIDPFDAVDIGFGDEEITFDTIAPEPPPEPKKAPERLQAAVEQHAVERLVSPSTDASVGQAFQLLATTVLSSSPRTLEDMVAEMLRPMLKSWLDENLPGMVERLVKAEIERVARGR